MTYKLLTEIDKINRKKWSDFVFNHPDGNIFQSPEMHEVYEKTEKYEPVFLAVKENNDIFGILLAVIQKEHSGFIGKFSSRSIIWGGPLLKDNNEKVLDLLLKEYNRKIKKKAIYSQFRNLWNWGDLRKSFEINGFTFEDHLDIFFDLNYSEEDLLMQMHKQRRHNVRRAKNKGTVFTEITNIDGIKQSYQLVKETYKRVKLPVGDEDFFLTAFEVLYQKKMARFFGAYHLDKLIGVRVVLCYKDLVYDWYAGSSYKDTNKYPNDFLPWEIMLWSKNNGYKVFDFGGAGKPGVPYGVRNYKKKFGGEFVNYGRFEFIHKPILMKIGKVGLKIWKKLK